MRNKNAILIATIAISTWANAQVYVHPHVTKDGTYVPGYERTKPNSTVDDNYSTRGNVNPYTGTEGTKPRSYERPPEPAKNTYGSTCGYTSSGRYVCR